jgi:hypothetical protein
MIYEYSVKTKSLAFAVRRTAMELCHADLQRIAGNHAILAAISQFVVLGLSRASTFDVSSR